ncbi:MAG: protein kinase [Gammaproteobacteria bacterium]|nr:protein kinase [Gammaproteobacteria bacterium]
MAKAIPAPHVSVFNLRPGRKIGRIYEVVNKLGAGWEGEVYRIREINTGIERAAKLFYPQRNIRNKASRFYAQKLHKLRQCSMLIQYHTEEVFAFKGLQITALISEYVEGDLLLDFVRAAPAGRLSAYRGLHLLYAIVKGIEEVHAMHEYHGDLHPKNIIVSRFGLRFHLKLLDFYHWHGSTKSNRQDDMIDVIRIFYEAIGGKRYYAKQPDAVKNICCGLKRSLILKKFRDIAQLREHLEMLEWDTY